MQYTINKQTKMHRTCATYIANTRVVDKQTGNTNELICTAGHEKEGCQIGSDYRIEYT